MEKNKHPKNIDAVISFFQTNSDVGGFVVQKHKEDIEFDAYFSDEFLGKESEETYSTLITVIAAMRSMADNLTKRLVSISGVEEKKIHENIADVYYEIKKSRE